MGSSSSVAPSSVLLAAHLIAQPNPRGGTFARPNAKPRRNLEQHVNMFLSGSPATVAALAEGTLRMFVVHDIPSKATTRYRNITLLRLAESMRLPRIPANDARWSAFVHAWPTLGIAPKACVFTIDWPDVKVATGEVHHACAAHPAAIFVGSDICDARGVKRWMRGLVWAANYSASADLQALLGGIHGGSGSVFNCGIMGGVADVFAPFMASIVQRTALYYEGHPWQAGMCRCPGAANYSGSDGRTMIDMVIVNELVLERARRGEEVVTGWPHGPLNAPMTGNLCRRYKCSPDLIQTGAGRAVCRREALANLSRSHFFRHKLDCGVLIPCVMDREPPATDPFAALGMFPWTKARNQPAPTRQI